MRLRISLTLLLLAGALGGCASAPVAIDPDRITPPGGPVTEVVVVNHGWHTGLILPAADLNALLPGLDTRFPGRRHYELGWGDRDFYPADEVTSGLTLRALFLSRGSVMHVVAFDAPPAVCFPDSDPHPLRLDRRDYQNLLKFVRSSFATDEAGRVIPRQRGLYGDAWFFAGTGTFGPLSTCNKWVAKALYSGGVDLWPTFKLTAASVRAALPPKAAGPNAPHLATP